MRQIFLRKIDHNEYPIHVLRGKGGGLKYEIGTCICAALDLKMRSLVSGPTLEMGGFQSGSSWGKQDFGAEK